MDKGMILDRILAAKREDLAATKRRVSEAELRDAPWYASPRRNFRAALERARAIVAEVKRASPSKGVLREDFDPVKLAQAYARGGAAAISVLTESQFFHGHLDHVSAIRQAVSLPLLRKDFLFDPYQVHEARAFGADAILLIVRALHKSLLAEMLELATSLDLGALVEVHNEQELDTALSAGATLIGINNRDLATFHTSLETTERLVPLLPEGVLVVAESGIETRADIERLERVGVHAFLIGEALVRAADPAKKLRELLD